MTPAQETAIGVALSVALCAIGIAVLFFSPLVYEQARLDYCLEQTYRPLEMCYQMVGSYYERVCQVESMEHVFCDYIRSHCVKDGAFRRGVQLREQAIVTWLEPERVSAEVEVEDGPP